MILKRSIALCLLASLCSCGGNEEPKEDEDYGKQFDRAIEDAKKRLEDALESGDEESP